MKKFSVVAIGIVLLLAGLYTPVFADSGHGSSSVQAGSANRDALSDMSVAIGDHIKEIYTTLDPNQFAEKYFFTGETIYFVGSIYLNIPGTYYVYTMLTNVGGSVSLVDSYAYTPSSSNDTFWFFTDSLTSGTYNFSVLIFTANGILLSPIASTFVVQ